MKHACGHYKSAEATVAYNETEWRNGFCKLLQPKDGISAQDLYSDRKADPVVGVRDYVKYTDCREALFGAFPQVVKVVLLLLLLSILS